MARSGPRRSRGYTLVEIIFVLAFLAVAMGFALTRVDLSSYRMDSNVRLLQNAVIGAQQLAIQRNTVVQVMFDGAGQRVRILQDSIANGQMDEGEAVRYRPLMDGAQFRSPPATLDGATAAIVTGPGMIATVNPLQPTIRISPNGTLSGDAVVYLTSRAASAAHFRAVTIVGATARTGFWSYATGTWRPKDG